MASKSFSVIDSIDNQVNKLAPKNDAKESKNHVLPPFPSEDKDLPTQSAVSATAAIATINSTNNANANSKILIKSKTILIPSRTKETATNNRTNNENTNNNTANDSNTLLTSTSTATLTTTNNNINGTNTNNSENNTGINLKPSYWRTDEERNGSEECDNAHAAKQDVKEKVPILKFLFFKEMKLTI